MANAKKYIGSWSANNGSSRGVDYTFTSLRDACKTLRSLAAGATQAGQVGRWSVYLDGQEEPVKTGSVKG